MKSSNSNAKQALGTIAVIVFAAWWTSPSIVSAAASELTQVQVGEPATDWTFSQQQVSETAAPPASAPTEVAAAERRDNLMSGARAAGATIFILALILITMVLLKRYMPHRFGPLGHKRRIQILETVAIADKRTLTLVEVDGNTLLLASTPHSVSLLKEIGRNEGAESVQSETAAAAISTQEMTAVQRDSSKQGGDGVTPFKDTLAAEIGREAAINRLSPLARISGIRAELEAR